MKKIHSRAKKKIGLGTHVKHKARLLKKPRKSRPKTFKTEKAANEYAKSLGIKSYELKKVKKDKKFQVVEKS